MAGASFKPVTWARYLQEHLMCEIDGCQLTAGAIIATEECIPCIYAQSEAFPTFKAKELQMVVEELKKPGSTTMTEEGFVFGGQKYSLSEGNEKIIEGVSQESNIVFQRTRTIIVVGIYKPDPAVPDSAATCAQIVKNLANFFAGRNL